MSDPQVTPPVPKTLEPSSGARSMAEILAEILADNPKRFEFREQAEHFASTYYRILKDLRLVKSLEPIKAREPIKKVETVIYLIDFDVIRNLIDRSRAKLRRPRPSSFNRSHEKRQRVLGAVAEETHLPIQEKLRQALEEKRRQAAQMFEDPRFRYAIPIGAFSELVAWFKKLAPSYVVEKQPPTYLAGGDLKEVLWHIASALDVSQENLTETEFMREISSAVDQLALSATELLKFLKCDTFMGVYSDYDESTCSDLNSLIEQRTRKGGTARDNRDKNDAKNLAVVCHEANLKKANDSLASFVLLTQTKLLLDLVRSKSGTSEAHTLAHLFAKTNLHPTGYPVMRPQQAYCVEELREGGRVTDRSLKRVEEIKLAFDKIARELTKDSETDADGLSDPSGEETLMHRAERIEELLGEVAILEEDRLFRMIERERRIREPQNPPVSIEFEMSYGTTVEPSERQKIIARKDLETKLSSIFALLARVNQELRDKSPSLYEFKPDTHPHPSGAFHSFEVVSHAPNERVMEGEIYLDSSNSGNPLAYGLRWKTACSGETFLAVIREIFSLELPRSRGELPTSVQVTPAREDEDQPQEGFVIFTNKGAYRASLKQILGLSLFESTLKRIFVTAVERADESPQRLSLDNAPHDFGGEARKKRRIEIEAIRVQTRFGDFQIDLASDELGNREIAIISKFDIGQQVTFLCESTSLLGVFPDKLYDELHRITRQFPAYRHSRETTVQNVERANEAVRL